MEQIKTQLQKILELAGFDDFSITIDETSKNKIIIFINEGEWLKKWIPKLVGDLAQIAKALSQKHKLGIIHIDVNNYRRERENIITELAKAAARKAIINKTSVELPPMNAYERRLVHMELASRPDVITESIGEGPERHVVVKVL